MENLESPYFHTYKLEEFCDEKKINTNQTFCNVYKIIEGNILISIDKICDHNGARASLGQCLTDPSPT